MNQNTVNSSIMNFSDSASGTTLEVSPLEKEAMSKGRSPTKTWKQVTTSRARLKLMRSMRNEAQGFNCDEFYVRKLRGQARSSKFQGKGEKQVIKMVMGMKIVDQREELRRLKHEKNEARKEMMKQFGKGTMRFRKAMRRLNQCSRETEREDEARFAGKFQHLKRKHGESRRQREGEAKEIRTRWKGQYNNVLIYREQEDLEGFQKLLEEIDREQEDELAAVRLIGEGDGEGELSSPEKRVLRLPPGTAINPKLSEDQFRCENEILNVKLRYEQRKWEQQDADYHDGLEKLPLEGS